MGVPLRICMAHPNPGPECETFIQALVDRLPGVCDVLYGGHMPCFDGGGRLLTGREPESLPPDFAVDGIPATPRQQENYEALMLHLADLKPDVVLAEYGPTGVAMHRICRELGIPLTVKFHGYDCSVRETVGKYRAGYDALFPMAEALVCVSRSQRETLLEMGADEDKVHVIPTGVDTGGFGHASPASELPRFLSVGRFVEKKSPDTVVRAFAEVVKEVPGARLTMVGEGVLRNDCIRLAQELGVSGSVDFPGRMPHPAVRDALGRARCFVQHSVTAQNGDREGTPNAILEASASCLPVVATRHAGITDAVVHGTTGLLGDEHDVQAMAENMIRMARNPREAEAMGKAGREHMKMNYEMDRMTETLEQLLQRIVRESVA